MDLRLFSHINEFGPSAWSKLPAMIAMGSKVTIWSPSGRQLQRYHAEGRIPYGPRDILRLIDEGVIRVAGREKWLTGKSWRSKIAQDDAGFSAAWLPEFDGTLHAWARDSRQKVIITPDEKGEKLAMEHVKARSEKYKAAIRLLRLNQLPAGTRERIAHINGSTVTATNQRIAMVIRTAINSTKALEETGSNIAIDSARDPYLEFALLGDRPAVEIKAPTKEVTETKFFEVIGLLNEVATDVSIPTLIKLSREDRLKGEIRELLASDYSAATYLAAKVRDGLRQPRDAAEFLGDNDVDQAASLVGLALSIWGLKSISRRQFLSGSISLACGVATPTHAVLRDAGLTRVANDYAGPMIPFVLAEKINPTRDEVEQMANRLARQIKTRFAGD